MALITANPLPAGRYWSDLIGEEKIALWNSWRTAMNSTGSGSVNLLATTHHDADGDNPVREWVLYTTTKPLIYDHTSWAPVNSAGDDITAETDTVTKPDPEDISILPSTTDLASVADKLQTGLIVLAGAVGIATVVGLALKLRK